MEIIDLRSDTVTKPTPDMLKAMLIAEVGDDVFNEDPTIIKLECKTAEMFGKEAALFCPSGTMTNQIAIKCHTQPGDEVICESNSHIYHYEGGGIAFNSGAQARLIEGERGCMRATQIDEHINANYDWLARTALVSLENTVNRAGGSYYDIEEVEKIKTVCDENNLPLHLDGARIFNALIEKNYSAADFAKYFDSVSVCLSKGLGAPVGSLLLGTDDFIKKARKVRKVFGGGMRQAGILAAAGIYALDNNINRLSDDHKKARILEAALKKVGYVKSILPVETNIVIFNLNHEQTAASFIEKLKAHGINASAFGKHTVRFVTHLDFTDSMLPKVLNVLANESVFMER